MQQKAKDGIIGCVSTADIEHDRQLVAKAKQDPEAFGEIFDLYYKTILTYAARRTGDAEAAEDIAAQTFEKAQRGLWRYTWRNIPLLAWLYKIAGNEIRMWARKEKHKTYSLDVLIEAGFDRTDKEAVSERELLEAKLKEDREWARVTKALRQLPMKYQAVLSLRYMEGKSSAEIAVIVGKREGTVRSSLSRGLSMLRMLLAESQQNSKSRITTDESQGVLSAITQNNS
jgi:RNA polymerase sigma-70 factor, ECF subfamily